MKIFIKYIATICLLVLAMLAFASCGGNEDDVVIGPGGGHVHSMAVAKIAEATCTEGGYTLYECSCGATEVRDQTDPVGHAIETVGERPANCTEVGWEEYERCERGGCDYSTYVEIPALGHLEITYDAKPATCTEPGWDAYVRCDRAGCEYSTYSQIDAYTHIIESADAKQPTCTEQGWGMYEYCTREGCGYTTIEYAPPRNHDYFSYEWEWDGNTVARVVYTCTRDASHKMTVDATVTTQDRPATCSANAAKIYTAAVTVDGITYFDSRTVESQDTMLPHSYTGAPIWSWTEDGKATATFTCTRDSAHTECVNATVATDVTEPTCTASKVIKYTATVSFNGKSYTDIKNEYIDGTILGHDMELVGWTWTDYSRASVTLKCKRDESHVDTYSARITETTVSATCSAAGSTVYTATVTTANQTFTDVKTVEIPIKEHNYELVEWVWNGTESATAHFVCTANPDHKYSTTDTSESIYNEADCDSDAFTAYYVLVSVGGKPYNDSKAVTEEGTALGHNYVLNGWDWEDDFSAVKAHAYCLVCQRSNEAKSYDATVTHTEVPASCNAKGTRAYTATVVLEKQTFTDTKTVIIPPAHNMVDGTCTLCGYKISVGLEFKVEGGEAILMGRGSCTDEHIVVPDTYEGYPVTVVDSRAFRDDTTLKSIVLPLSVKRFNDIGSFAGCTSLESLTVPFVGGDCELTNVTTYGYLAYIFGGRDWGYNKSSVPASLKKVTVTGTYPVGGYAFRDCQNIETIVIAECVDSMGMGAMRNCTGLKYLTIPYLGSNLNANVTSTDISTKFAYIFGSSNNYYDTPNSVVELTITHATVISDKAFGYNNRNTTNIKKITLPACLTTIGNYAFYDCYGIEELIFEEGSQLTSVGDYFVQNCSGLTKIVLPKTLTKIGNYAFGGSGSSYFPTPYTRIYFEGTYEDWQKVSYNSKYNTVLNNTTVYYYSETRPETLDNTWHYAVDGVTPVLWSDEA